MKKTKAVIAALMICLHAHGQSPERVTYAGHDTSIEIDLSSVLHKESLNITISRKIAERWSISGMSGISFGHFRKNEDADEKAAHESEFETDIEPSSMTEVMQAAVSVEYWPYGVYEGFHAGTAVQTGFKGNRIECIGFIGYRMTIYKGLHMEMTMEEGLTAGIRKHYTSTGNIRIRLCCTF